MIRHIITCEYPPQPGGVSDHTRVMAEALQAAGEEVHVWCPSADSVSSARSEVDNDVAVHRELGRVTPRDLRRLGRELDQFPTPRRVLVQWVPHGYAFHAMNLWFCLWLWQRARRHRDEIELMVHEPYLSFGEGSCKQNLIACVHRLMTIVLLRAARRVWISIPAWEACWRPYTLGRPIQFTWLPVGSTIHVESAHDADTMRARYLKHGGTLIGHFGAYDRSTARLLSNLVPELMAREPNATLLLVGHGSAEMRSTIILKDPSLASRVHGTGTLDAADVSRHISACDVMLQPYIDGVSSRRSSTMAALAHGIPVVTNAGRLTESFWRDQSAVALASVENSSELVEATQRLSADVAARHGLSEASRAFYAEYFDSARAIKRLREV